MTYLRCAPGRWAALPPGQLPRDKAYDRHAHELGVLAGLIPEPVDGDRAGDDQTAGEGRLVHQHQRVQGSRPGPRRGCPSPGVGRSPWLPPIDRTDSTAHTYQGLGVPAPASLSSCSSLWPGPRVVCGFGRGCQVVGRQFARWRWRSRNGSVTSTGWPMKVWAPVPVTTSRPAGSRLATVSAQCSTAGPARRPASAKAPAG